MGNIVITAAVRALLVILAAYLRSSGSDLASAVIKEAVKDQN